MNVTGNTILINGGSEGSVRRSRYLESPKLVLKQQVAAVKDVIAPFVRDRGFNWEFQI